jgi:taurine dioxygenase
MLEISRLDGPFGARVRGLDLGETLCDAALLSLVDALYRHRIVVIENQILSTEAYLRFGRRWGEPIRFLREDQRVDGLPEVIIVSNSPTLFKEGERDYAVHWHSDSTYEDVPASTTMLYCLEAPAIGGETLFADMVAAYDALPPEHRSRIDGLLVKHRAGAGQREAEYGERPHSAKPFSAEARRRIRTFLHPLALRHPATGRKSLYGVAGTAFGIEGLADDEAMAAIGELKQHALQDRFRTRYTARAGDVLIWDNFSVIHTATPAEYSLEDGKRRLLHRISVTGIPPVLAVREPG